MKKTLVSFLSLLCFIMAFATEITVGSYNIRVYTPNDLGPHFWNNRREYVVQTMRDARMDIVGLNEVKLRTQGAYLEETMTEYTFVGWDGKMGVNPDDYPDPTADLIGFRNSMFDLLDWGVFHLCRTPETWVCDWDNSEGNNRHCAWAKLQVKETGEILFFFCTHLDHAGNIARMLQAHLCSDKTWEIAGHYPTVYLGDQNSSETRKNFHYRFTSNFDDAFAVTGSAARYGSNPATSGQWNEPISGSRIDWIWTRGCKVLAYDHHENNYDLGARPSDHIAISAKLQLLDPELDRHHLYVAPGGDGNGTKDSPFGTLAQAVKAAHRGDTIYMAAGDYPTPSVLKLTKFVHVFGGYDAAFEKAEGLSKIKMTEAIRAIELNDTTELEMRNVGIYNGAPASSDGGAIRGKYGRLVLRDCEFADNQSIRDGGAIDHMGHLELYNVRFLRNKAGRNGGAVCCDNPTKRYWFNYPVDGCFFEGNEAENSGGAMHLPRFVYAWISNNTFSANTTHHGPTLFLQALGTDNNLGADLTVWNNTFVGNTTDGVRDDAAETPTKHGASAMYIDIEPASAVSIVNNTILGNESLSNIPAVYMQQGTPFIGNNIVACNKGGDFFINSDGISASYNVYTSEETVNLAHNSKDIVSTGYDSCGAMLASMLDCTMAGGVLKANLTTSEDAGYFTAPAVAVLNPVNADGRTLCCVTQTRLKENMLRADFDRDCMRQGSLKTDAFGLPRPTDATVTIGAVEYQSSGALDNVMSDRRTFTDGIEEWFDLQGRRIARPDAPGIYIHRCGSTVEKISVR